MLCFLWPLLCLVFCAVFFCPFPLPPPRPLPAYSPAAAPLATPAPAATPWPLTRSPAPTVSRKAACPCFQGLVRCSAELHCLESHLALPQYELAVVARCSQLATSFLASRLSPYLTSLLTTSLASPPLLLHHLAGFPTSLATPPPLLHHLFLPSASSPRLTTTLPVHPLHLQTPSTTSMAWLALALGAQRTATTPPMLLPSSAMWRRWT